MKQNDLEESQDKAGAEKQGQRKRGHPKTGSEQENMHVEEGPLKAANELKEAISSLFRSQSSDALKALGGVAGVEQRLGEVENKKEFGENVIKAPKAQRLLKLIKIQMEDKTLRYLGFVSVISNAVGAYEFLTKGKHSYIEGVSIIVVIGVIVTIGVVSERKKEASVTKLKDKATKTRVKVVKDKKKELVDGDTLLVGDCVWLEPGDVVPGDILAKEWNALSCDESMVSGESEWVGKGEEDPFLVSGTYVVSGTCLGLVVAVGSSCVRGRLDEIVYAERKEKTVLQKKLEVLVDRLAVFGASLSGAIFLCNALRITVGASDKTFLSALIEAISLTTVAIPEGLPMAVTMSLVYASLQMYKSNALVRSISKCETMNSTTVVCLDKTGTLTKNTMVVKKVFANGQVHPIANFLKISVVDEITVGVLVNSTAFVGKDGVHGPKTEVALVEALVREGAYQSLHLDGCLVQPFSSTRKYMSTYVPVQASNESSLYMHGHGNRTYFKGAPEVLLPNCQTMLGDCGPVPISSTVFDACQALNNSYRCICMCYREGRGLEVASECDLVFVAMLGLEDDLRSDVEECAAAFESAQIGLKIVTGDSKNTTVMVANAVGILKDDDLLLSGEEFRALSDEDATRNLDNLKILYRSIPEDKLRLVTLLKKKGEIVGVTGDGANDAPALKHSDIGFALGCGTEAAKNASDIVLLRGEFTALIKSIGWGRCVNDNIRKFTQFQLTLTLSTITLSILDAVFQYDPTSLSTFKILWMNFIGDTIASIGFSSNSPTPQTFSRAPESLEAPIVTTRMVRYIAANYALQMLGVFFLHRHQLGKPFIFNAFVFMQIFGLVTANTLNFRVAEIFTSTTTNPILAVLIVATATVQSGSTLFLSRRTQTLPASLYDGLCSIICAGTVLGLGLAICLLKKEKKAGIHNERPRPGTFSTQEHSLVSV
ncbi:Ca2+-transporting ATPase [Nematocida displodere]|uniref:Calcium-transporting ATPase n=1 Tax=Nematocida displodere TaxID=1805483 RepID=A0A177EB66_9MICR|nr:Ca2+-transporting ATPase [Nematocida displodere]